MTGEAQDIFGWRISPQNAAEITRTITAAPLPEGAGMHLFITPNIQHVADMRHEADLKQAIEKADIVVCDGFPVAYYARLRGNDIPGRVTGREVTEQIMLHADLHRSHRLFFLVDGEETAQAVRQWASQHPAQPDCMVEVAPPCFGSDTAYCTALAARICAYRTTLLFLCVGAPRSELFAWRYRNALPNCWALCVGQSARVTLNLVRHPPVLVERLNLEWLWRIAIEPRRLAGRYVRSAAGFIMAIYDDLQRKNKSHSESRYRR